MTTQATGGSNMPPLIDPIFSDIQRHQAAWEALLESLGSKDETAPKLALEDARSALVDLVGASRQLALARFRTMRGAIALLRYLSAALMVPGAPRLPIETAFDMQWELAFGSTCKSVADSLTALQTEPAVVDAVAEAIVGALAPAIEDFEMAKRAARAAISAFVDGGVR